MVGKGSLKVMLSWDPGGSEGVKKNSKVDTLAGGEFREGDFHSELESRAKMNW